MAIAPHDTTNAAKEVPTIIALCHIENRFGE
jgi:hypothetical protein